MPSINSGLDKVFGSGILFIVLWVRDGHLKDALQKPGSSPGFCAYALRISCAGGANMSIDNLIINAEPDGSVRVTVTAESGPGISMTVSTVVDWRTFCRRAGPP